MSVRATFRGLLMAGLLIAPLFLGAFVTSSGVKPVELEITGADYAFIGVPQKVRAGQLTVSFKNIGKVRHELVVARLDPGATPERIVEKLKQGAVPRDVIAAGGLLFADAGKQSPVRLLLNVSRGESYMVYCNFQDSVSKPRHWALGMYSGFTVK